MHWSEDPAKGWVEVTYNGQQVLPRTYLSILYPGLSGSEQLPQDRFLRAAEVSGTGVVYHDRLRVTQH